MSFTVSTPARSVKERLNAIMKERKITQEQLANALSTSVGTMGNWLYRGSTAPSSVVAMLDLIESDSKCGANVRAKLGLRHKHATRKSGFKPGNPWRINDPRRPQAMKEARAKRKKAKD